jgi:hypothetical protein
MAPTLLQRLRIATTAALTLGGVTVGAALAVAHATTAEQNAVPAGAVPGVLQTPGSGACITEAQARGVWQTVDDRVNALVLHPSTAAVAALAQGTAATQLRAYVQQRLLDQHLTEREVQRLDSISVLQPACGSQPLTVRVYVTLVQDDYLAADGHVDHRDPGVGQSSEVIESYVRTPGGWKVITIATLGTPAPSPGITV